MSLFVEIRVALGQDSRIRVGQTLVSNKCGANMNRNPTHLLIGKKISMGFNQYNEAG